MKQYDYRPKEHISMEGAYNKVIGWIFKVQDEILTANEKYVLIKIVGMMRHKGEKVLKDVSLEDIRIGMNLTNDEVEEAVWRFVEHGFFREIYRQDCVSSEKLYSVYSNLHLYEIECETVA